MGTDKANGAVCTRIDCREPRESPSGTLCRAHREALSAGKVPDTLCARAGCYEVQETPTSAYCREHGTALSRGLALAGDDQLARASKMDAGQCTTPGCTGRPEPKQVICAKCASGCKPWCGMPDQARAAEGYAEAVRSGIHLQGQYYCKVECRPKGRGPHQFIAAPPARVAPTLAEVRQARLGGARDIEKRKEELAAHLASVFPDCNFVVRIAFEVRPNLSAERRGAAEAKILAAGIVSQPCQCLRWEEWAQTIVGARGGASEAYKSLRDRVTAVLGTASKTTSDAHAVGRDALAVTRAAQQDAENARKAERSADGRLRQAQSLLRRCYCGRPDPDPEYPRDRDKYLGRS